MNTSRTPGFLPFLLACFLVILALGGGPRAASAADDQPPAPAPSVESDAGGRDSLQQGGPIRFEWDATYASWYSFQGFDYSNHRPVLQPELSAAVKGFSIGAWGNLDQSLGELNEVDATLRWDWEASHLSGGLGYVNLQYPNRTGWSPSQELLGEVSLNAPLQPSASFHWDVDQGRGVYATLGIGGEIPLAPASAVLAAKLYAQDRYYGVTGISALETRAGVRRVWGGMAWEPALSRLWSWKNGDFRGANAIASSWLFSVSLSPR